MEHVTVGKIHVKIDDNGKVYVGRCPECMKMLDGEEMAYGHDCEEENEQFRENCYALCKTICRDYC